MKLIEENARKIVLADASGGLGVLGWGVVITICLGPMIASLYAMGAIQNTRPYREAVRSGVEVMGFSLIFGMGLAVIMAFLLYEFLRTYPVMVLDKTEGQLILQRVRVRNGASNTVRVIDLAEIRHARVGDSEDLCRLEFELTNGEIVTGRRGYPGGYSRPDLYSLTERINAFLGIASPTRA